MRSLEILAASPATFVEDLGRPGYAHVGVGYAGAADRASHRLANRLVGNPESDATIEVTFGGLRFRPDANVLVSVTGAPAPVTIDGRPADHASPLHVPAGATVELGTPASGLRSYVAVAGGIDVEPVLGSRSWDTMAKLGPEPLRAGVRLPVGSHPTDPAHVGHAPTLAPTDEVVEVRLIPGPRDAWVEYEDLFKRPWATSPKSDRVGVRLEGKPVRRASGYEERELTSEGVVRGSVQVPAGGLPVVFLADHPVTGGYPVVGVVRSADLDLIAQCRPGQQVRFRHDREFPRG